MEKSDVNLLISLRVRSAITALEEVSHCLETFRDTMANKEEVPGLDVAIEIVQGCANILKKE